MSNSIRTTTCPNCGGPAHWTADDAITWCDNSPNCGPNVAPQHLNYSPPNHRGEGNYSLIKDKV